MTRRVILVLACWMLAAAAGAGQSYQGGVRGFVSDTDAVVPGVDVTLTNEQTNIARSTVTNPTAAWLNPKAFAVAPAGTWGNAPRVVTDVRSPKPILTDISVARNVRIGGAREAQVKVEVFNLFNRVQTGGFASVSAGTAAFGQINAMQGFMRTTQIMVRYSW